jgi:hypothetical protein
VVRAQLPCRDFACAVQAESRRLATSRNNNTFFIFISYEFLPRRRIEYSICSLYERMVHSKLEFLIPY